MKIFYVLFKVESLPCSIHFINDEYCKEKTRPYNYKKRIFIGKEVTYNSPIKSKYMGEESCYALRKGMKLKGKGDIEKGKQFFKKTILGIFSSQDELDHAYSQCMNEKKEKCSTYYNGAYVVTRSEEHKQKIKEALIKSWANKKNIDKPK